MACRTLTPRSARRRQSLKTILAVVALGTCSCAASWSPPPAHPAPSVTTATAAPATAATPRVQLTGAVQAAPGDTPSPFAAVATAPVTPRWTDAEIVAALDAAEANQYSEARTARARSHSVRVERFASDLVTDDRELEHARRALPRRDEPAPSELLAEVQEARGEVADTLHSASPASFDHDFIAAEIRYERALGQLIQDEMIPSATAPELKEYLQDLRAKTTRARLAAEQIETYLH